MTDLLEIIAKVSDARSNAKRQLHALERVLVENGYTRNRMYRPERKPRGVYNPGIFFIDGKIKIARGKDHELGTVENMTERELRFVAAHLPGFIDNLEGGARWTLRELEGVVTKAERYAEAVKDDPNPLPYGPLPEGV